MTFKPLALSRWTDNRRNKRQVWLGLTLFSVIKWGITHTTRIHVIKINLWVQGGKVGNFLNVPKLLSKNKLWSSGLAAGNWLSWQRLGNRHCRRNQDSLVWTEGLETSRTPTTSQLILVLVSQSLSKMENQKENSVELSLIGGNVLIHSGYNFHFSSAERFESHSYKYSVKIFPNDIQTSSFVKMNR